MTGTATKSWWERGVQSGWIEVYEQEMIRFMEQQYGELSDDVKLCIVFTSLFLKAGHTCLPLNEKITTWGEILGLDSDEIVRLPKGHIELSGLIDSPVIGIDEEATPLILSKNLLSIRRYRIQEIKLLQWIKEISSNNNIPDINDYISINSAKTDSDEVDWQKIAAVLSVIKPFLIISGGPGTGKTTTVAKILELQQRISDRPLRIALAAPTGKAAGRMGEALFEQLSKMDINENDLRNFPAEAKTIHRLLAGSDDRDLLPPVEKKLLRYDLVIVDEASMIDLPLMYRLIRHLGPETRLILLGDKDQLASVEAGSVFADLCQKKENGFREETLKKLKEIGLNESLPLSRQSSLDDSIIYLTKSYRFGEKSGIGKLAGIVKNGHEHEAELLSVFTRFEDLHHEEFDYQKEDFDRMINSIMERVKGAEPINDPGKMIGYWKESVWLSVLRRGLGGTDRLNRLAEQQIASRRLVKMDIGWYHGRPVMITQNDYNLGLFNGDLGVCLKDQNDESWVYVESGPEIKKIKPQRISHFNPAYFLTVHKSQGSEFNHVNLLLPRSDHRLMTRELIYTAITRAKTRFSLYGSLEIFRKGIGRQTLRYTGLKEMLG